MRVVAVDRDSGDNGRVSYVITSGNEEARFTVGYESGIVSLAKPIARPTDLEITANDHGSPPRRAVLRLSLIPVTARASGPPRLLLSNPVASIAENLQIGAPVLNVAGPAVADQGKRKIESSSLPSRVSKFRGTLPSAEREASPVRISSIRRSWNDQARGSARGKSEQKRASKTYRCLGGRAGGTSSRSRDGCVLIVFRWCAHIKSADSVMRKGAANLAGV